MTLIVFSWLCSFSLEQHKTDIVDGVNKCTIDNDNEPPAEVIQRRPKSQKKNMTDEEINEGLREFDCFFENKWKKKNYYIISIKTFLFQLLLPSTNCPHCICFILNLLSSNECKEVTFLLKKYANFYFYKDKSGPRAFPIFIEILQKTLKTYPCIRILVLCKLLPFIEALVYMRHSRCCLHDKKKKWIRKYK